MASPPFPSIDPPVLYASWNHFLFTDGTNNTHTLVYNHPTSPDLRVAYGVTSLVNFWFFVSMTPSQETQFHSIWTAWRNKPVNSGNTHEYTAYSTKPPTCGTPNTLPCPPDPQLSGRIEALAELVAGAGASKQEVAAAKAKVTAMLMKTLDGALALIDR